MSALSRTNPLAWLASLRLTVLLLAMGMYLIFVGTLAQVENGIWQVVNDYFRWGNNGMVMVPFDVFRALIYPGSENTWAGAHPFPGGFLILGALIVNLLAAHAVRFKITGKGGVLWAGVALIVVSSVVTGYTVLEPNTSATIQQDVMLMLGIWALPMALLGAGCYLVFGKRKAGIALVHAGLILMLLGEFITGLYAEEGQVFIPEFGGSNTKIDIREVEIGFVTDLGEGKAKHVVVPQGMIERAAKNDEWITDTQVPLAIRVDAWMGNSELQPDLNDGDSGGLSWRATKVPEVTGTEMRADRPSVMVTLFDGDERVGQHLLSTWDFVKPVRVEVDGQAWDVSLRFKHTPLDYTLQLHDFRHDLFTGTRRARNFSSDLRLVTNDAEGHREAFVKMNQPLRYDGKAFFQAGFFQQPLNRNLGTILQVADNPGAWVPYLSCVIVTLGLTIHFFASLLQYSRRAMA